jgi:small-conductance mechanosensitive channel
MICITWEWVFGIVGIGVLYACFRFSRLLVMEYGWREVARELRDLLFTGTGAFVAFAYMIGMGFLVNKLTSSGWVAVLLWFLLMILPTVGYAVVTTKIIIPRRKKKEQGSNTGKINKG